MSFGQCDLDSSGAPIVQSLSSTGGGGSDVDITKWGAQRLNLCMYDVQQTIQEGLANGIIPYNISGNTIPGSQA
jgi:hypothetical protein